MSGDAQNMIGKRALKLKPLNDEAIEGSLLNNNELDEEKEQAMLEEARKKKERALKMREMQQKMLADVKAKKDAKEKEELEKKARYEK